MAFSPANVELANHMGDPLRPPVAQAHTAFTGLSGLSFNLGHGAPVTSSDRAIIGVPQRATQQAQQDAAQTRYPN